ncbi:putative histamine N-monooxygenase [Alcanivoracaceae bacterium MT1]
MDIEPLDLTGIGIGPFNLGLAALLAPHCGIRSRFLERKSEFSWHNGMMLPGTTLQVPFLADLVTMADPTNSLSFLNYLHAHDRLYQFYYHESFHVPREEYEHYCRWASRQLMSCRFGEEVTSVVHETSSDTFVIESRQSSGDSRHYRSRDLALGIGTVPFLPHWAETCTSAPLVHSAQFADWLGRLSKCRQVTVVGAGQSAAECVLALYQALTPKMIESGASIHWITRSPGFHPMEYSKLGQECFTPAHLHYFHDIPRERRREIVAGQGLLYKGISVSTIAEVFDLMYERSVGGRDPGLSLAANCEVIAVEEPAPGRLRLEMRHMILGQTSYLESDAIVAATGYHHAWPAWFDNLKERVLETDSKGDAIVEANFTARRRDGGSGRIFIQNAEIFQHGVGAPDLGLGAYRNATIANQLLGREHYRHSSRSSFQDYGMPTFSIVVEDGPVSREQY